VPAHTGTLAVHFHRRPTVKQIKDMEPHERLELSLGIQAGGDEGKWIGAGLGAVAACVVLALSPAETPAAALAIRCGVLIGAATGAGWILGRLSGCKHECDLIRQGYYDKVENRVTYQAAEERMRAMMAQVRNHHR
jgi:hypothetical protein